MSKCRYCRTEVPDELMGYHYAGFQQPPCPDVAYAFGPEPPRRPKAINPQLAPAYPLPGEHAPRGPHGKNQTLGDKRARRREWNRKRRAAMHAGERL